MWQKLAWLAAAGTLGTFSRYFLSGLVQRLHDGEFPWGTLAVNALGCLLFGLVWTLAEERSLISAQNRAILLIGFMGAFTTFSTYVFETGQMLRDSEWLLAMGNFAGQNVLGFVSLYLGAVLARLL